MPENTENTDASIPTNNAAVLAALLGKCEHKNPALQDLAKHVTTNNQLLKSQAWYMGMLHSNTIANYLKDVESFGVHAQEEKSGSVQLMLSIRGRNTLHHLPIIFVGSNGWTLERDDKTFKTVIDLVNFYSCNPLPNIDPPIFLRTACLRPSWFLRHESVTYERKDLLGSGNFCDVYKGRFNRRAVAVKVCQFNWRTDDTTSMRSTDKEHQARTSLIQEGSVMSTIRHPNCITFYGICFDHPPIMMALELCPGGSLQKHLQDFKKEITIGEQIKYLIEAAEGMSFLEVNKLVHRDLAARNCLISKYGKIKIADFGLSRLVSEIAGENYRYQQLPVRWMAPETLCMDPDYSSKSDVWSFGILIYEVFTKGIKPWPDWDNRLIAQHIRRADMPDFPGYTPPKIRSLVRLLWNIVPRERPDFARIVKYLHDIQFEYQPPRPAACTTSKLPGVTVLSAAEIEVLQENSEDELLDAAVTSMVAVINTTRISPTAPPIPAPEEGKPVQSIDEVSPPGKPAFKKVRRRTVKTRTQDNTTEDQTGAGPKQRGPRRPKRSASPVERTLDRTSDEQRQTTNEELDVRAPRSVNNNRKQRNRNTTARKHRNRR